MSERFDPYLRWLGIRDPQRPLNHYRLLGLELFESDSDVIANAADRQMAHVRTFQTSKHSTLSQRVLNELAGAKVCLLNPEKKAAYDAGLAALRAAAEKAVPVPPPLPPVPPPLPAAAALLAECPSLERGHAGPSLRARSRGRGKKRNIAAAWAVLVTVAVSVVLIGAWACLADRGTPHESKQTKESTVKTCKSDAGGKTVAPAARARRP
jgi:hypothetical protein